MCFNFITPTGSCDVDPACIPRVEYSYNNVLRNPTGDSLEMHVYSVQWQFPQFGSDGVSLTFKSRPISDLWRGYDAVGTGSIAMLENYSGNSAHSPHWEENLALGD